MGYRSQDCGYVETNAVQTEGRMAKRTGKQSSEESGERGPAEGYVTPSDMMTMITKMYEHRDKELKSKLAQWEREFAGREERKERENKKERGREWEEMDRRWEGLLARTLPNTGNHDRRVEGATPGREGQTYRPSSSGRSRKERTLIHT